MTQIIETEAQAGSFVEMDIQRPSFSAGELIHTARIQQGLTILAIANRLKIPSAKIEALEINHYDLVGDMVFVRALTRSVCKVLNIDPRDILNSMPGLELSKNDFNGLEKPFSKRETIGSLGGHWVWLDLRSIIIASPINWLVISVLIIAAIACAWWYTQIDQSYFALESNVEVPNTELKKDVLNPAKSHTASDLSLVAISSEPNASKVDVVQTIPVDMTPASVVVSAGHESSLNADNQKNSVLSSLEDVKSSEKIKSSFELKFIVKYDSWVKLSDSNGQVIYSGLMKVGQDVKLFAPALSKLVIGNAAGVEFELNGSPVDISSKTKNNVFRMELK